MTEEKKEKKKEYNKKYREKKKKVTFNDIPQVEEIKEIKEIKEIPKVEKRKEVQEDDTITLEEYVEYLVKKNQGDEKKNFEFSYSKISLFFILIFITNNITNIKSFIRFSNKIFKNTARAIYFVYFSIITTLILLNLYLLKIIFL